MKKILILILGCCCSLLLQAQIAKTVNVTTPGTLSTLLDSTQKRTVTDLTVTGTIDVRDFNTMRSMRTLINLDLSAVTIAAYKSATLGSYPANTIPAFAFDDDYIPLILTSIKLPASIDTIGQSAFALCKNLKRIDIPPSVKYLGFQAFAGCDGITSIAIPSSVTYFGNYFLTGLTAGGDFGNVRKNNTTLKSIYINTSTPNDLHLTPYCFNGVDSVNCTLYVPIGSKAAYQVAPIWNYFKNIVEYGSQDFSYIKNVIDSANSLANSAIIGTAVGNYPLSAKDALFVAISTAEATANNTTATQVVIDAATVALQNAITAFNATGIEPFTAGTDFLIDNMDDNNDVNIFGGKWYTFNDSLYNSGGKSSVIPYPQTTFKMTKGDKDGGYFAGISYKINNGYVGLGITLNASNSQFVATNLQGSTGLSFYFKGNADEIYVTQTYQNGVTYFSSKLPESNTWTKVNILWSDFKWETWQTQKDTALDLTRISTIYWQKAINTLTLADSMGVDSLVLNSTFKYNLTLIKATIDSANTLANSAIVGTAIGNYPQYALNSLNSAIASAQATVSGTIYTKAAIDAATVALQNAITVFKVSQIQQTSNEPGLLIDNMEDNNDVNNLGGKWYTFSDSTIVNGSETTTIPSHYQIFTMTKGDKNGDYYAGFYYKLGCVNKNMNGYAAMGMSLSSSVSTNIVGSTGISFYYKGKASTVVVEQLYKGNPMFFGKKIPESKTWTKIDLKWSDFQKSWQLTDTLLDLTRINSIQWSVDASSATDTSSGFIGVDSLVLNGKLYNPLTNLTIAINSANSIAALAIVGTANGNYPQSALVSLNSAIASALATANNTTATQANINVATVALQIAIDAFKLSVIDTGFLVDNMEDNDEKNNLGGIWFTQSDSLITGNSSVTPYIYSPFYMAKDVVNNNYFAQMNYKLSATNTNAWVVMGTSVYEYMTGSTINYFADLTGTTGVTFNYKGDSCIFFVTTNNNSGSSLRYYTKAVPASLNWTKVMINWTDLTQSYNGSDALSAFDITKVQTINWEVVGKSKTDTSSGFIAVDNVRLEGTFNNSKPKIQFTQSSIAINKYHSNDIKQYVTVKNVASVGYKSLNSTIAIVDANGIISALQAGQTSVVVYNTSDTTVADTAEITVAEVKEISFVLSRFILFETDTIDFSKCVQTINNVTTTLSIADTNKATISSVKMLIGKKYGTTKIFASNSINSLQKDSATILVLPNIKIESVNVSNSGTQLEIIVNGDYSLYSGIENDFSVSSQLKSGTNITVTKVLKKAGSPNVLLLLLDSPIPSNQTVTIAYAPIDANTGTAKVRSSVAVKTTTVIEALAIETKLYPNPAQSNITIEATDLQTVNIYNVQGQLLSSTFATGESTTVSIDNLASGLYIAEIITRTGNVKRSFVKR